MTTTYELKNIREIIICNKKFEIDIMRESILKLKNNNLLDEKFQEEDKNLLLFAIFFKNIDITKTLIDCGANVEISDCNKMTPLMWACYFNLSEIVELLVKKNANLNCQTVLYEWTALMHGSYTNSAESVKILLENNANINIIDSEGKKAIDIAKREGHEEIIELLKIHDNLNH